MDSKHRIKSFQSVRGIAIILILLSHYNLFINENGSNMFLYAGALGTSIFMILSGYMAMKSFRKTTFSRWQILSFLRKKLIQFYPLHIITLIAAIPFRLSLFCDNSEKFGMMKFVANALLLQSWIPDSSFYFSFNAVSWYLSATVYFVFITPMVVSCLRKWSKRRIYVLISVIILTEYLWCIFCEGSTNVHWLIYICPLVRSLDFVMGGCLFVLVDELDEKYRAFIFKKSRMLVIGEIIICGGLIIGSIISPSAYYYVAVWNVPALFMVMLAEICQNCCNSILNNKILNKIGNISFQLFLLHQLTLLYATKLFEKLEIDIGGFVYLVAIIAAIVGALLWKIGMKCKKFKLRK